jgi:hypothetical protein
MKRVVLALILVLTVACSKARCDAPANPLEITTEIGSAACEAGKVTVYAKATVTKKDVKLVAILAVDRAFAGNIELDADTLARVEDALKDILAKPDKDYSKKVGNCTVESKEKKDKRIVTITSGELFKADLTLDMDNAEALAKLLKKTRGVHDWMKEKLSALQK